MNSKRFFLTKIIISAFAFAAIAVIPSFAQETMRQAEQIKDAEQAAVNANTASESRSLGNEAWDGSNKTEGTATEEGLVDPKDVGTDETQTQQGIINNQKNSNTPTVAATQDVTPWKHEAKALKYLFMTAMILLSTASVLANTPKGKVIAITLSSIAIAASLAAVALAFTIMFKFNQYAYGGMWLAVAGGGLITCAVACIAGVKAYNAAKKNAQATINVYLQVILTLLGLGGSTLSNTIGAEAEEYINEEEKQKYCVEHVNFSECKTGSLPYELRVNLSEIDRIDC